MFYHTMAKNDKVKQIFPTAVAFVLTEAFITNVSFSRKYICKKL